MAIISLFHLATRQVTDSVMAGNYLQTEKSKKKNIKEMELDQGSAWLRDAHFTLWKRWMKLMSIAEESVKWNCIQKYQSWTCGRFIYLRSRIWSNQ